MKNMRLFALILAGALAGCQAMPAPAAAPLAASAVPETVNGAPGETASPLPEQTSLPLTTPAGWQAAATETQAAATETQAAATETQAPLLTLPVALSPSITPTPETFRLPPPPENRTRYRLEASLDYAAHFLSVEEHIAYFNATQDQQEALILVVEAQRYPGCFQLTGLYDQDGKRLLQYRLKDTTLTLHLPQSLAAGETLEFSISYTLRLLDVSKQPRWRPYPLGYSSLQANFGDWYPFIPAYETGKGWLAHPPALFGEQLVEDIADFDVSIRFLGAQTDLVMAASSPAVVEGEQRRYSHQAARSFAWSVSPYYQVMTQTVQVAADRSTLLASYYFPFHEEAGKSLLETLTQALPLYSELFGAYPHTMFSGVQADFLDGMEYDGLFFLSTDFYNWHKDSQADFLVTLAAHETAHQWWYGIVGNDQAMQPWLDEALCTYSERLYYENVAPEALDWWWTYRINYYQPAGWVDISVYDVLNLAGQYQAYRNPVYLKGAIFLEELRMLIGEQAFFDALRGYLSRYAYRQADAAGFFDVLRQHTSQELEPVVSKYFRKPPP